MTQMRKEDLHEMLRFRGDCVSIYLPTHRKGAEVQQDAIRLKNLLREAGEELASRPLRSSQIEEILEPAQRLIKETPFWMRQRGGLAIFLAPGHARDFLVDAAFEPLVVVSDRFHLRPLLPVLHGNRSFYLLAASKNQLRFFEGDRDSLSEIALPGVPKSLEEALQYENPEKQLQFRTPAPGGRTGRAAIFHGHGGGTDDAERKKELLRYFRQVDAGLREHLKNNGRPLVFAGVEYLYPLFREACSYPGLLAGQIPGNPDEIPPAELHRKAWDLIEPYFQRERDAAAARMRQHSGTEKTAESVEGVVLAAQQGRVEVLFVSADIRKWGALDDRGETVMMRNERSPGDEDLLDRAALETLLNGGTVYTVKRDEMPVPAVAAALLRY